VQVTFTFRSIVFFLVHFFSFSPLPFKISVVAFQTFLIFSLWKSPSYVDRIFAYDLPSSTLNNRTIIGILTMANEYSYPKGMTAYLPASYVKWVESSGARVAVVPYDATEEQLEIIFRSINGLLFTGGGQSLLPETKYYQAAAFLYNLATQANNQGDYFPIWGTCMGLQLLSLITADDQTVLSRGEFDAENLSLPVEFAEEAPSSRMFSNCPLDISTYFAIESITDNLHHDGVKVDVFNSNRKLSEFYRLIATNADRKGLYSISVIEGKLYPIYAVQFHPERNAFEWDLQETASHTSHAIRSMQYLSNFFVDECRKNFHRYESEKEENQALIYNYPVMYTGNDTSGFPDRQTYFF